MSGMSVNRTLNQPVEMDGFKNDYRPGSLSLPPTVHVLDPAKARGVFDRARPREAPDLAGRG